MKDRHLSDEQLQDFLDGNLSADHPLSAHLHACPRCREALAAYKTVYAGLTEDPGFELAPDFAESVMRILPEKQHIAAAARTDHSSFWERAFGFGWPAALGVVAGYFLIPMFLGKTWMEWLALPDLTQNRFLVGLFKGLSALAPHDRLIASIVIGIVVIGLIDRILTRRRMHKPVSFMI
jgi:hypothetical protein